MKQLFSGKIGTQGRAKRRVSPLLAVLSFATVLLLGGGQAFGQGFSVTITVDENGNGRFTNTNGFNQALPGVLAPDPGPGGNPSALLYDLLGPPRMVSGDLFLQEIVGGPMSDLIRFNATSTSTGNLVFYSDTLDGGTDLADRAFPTANYTNVLTMLEVGPEGSNGLVYTPTAGQPGFVAGAAGPVTYVIISDLATPEPASVALLGIGGVVLAGYGWRNRKRAK